MNLQKGCPYCSNLVCVEEPLIKFECAVDKELEIINVGACFVKKIENSIEVVESCPNFEE